MQAKHSTTKPIAALIAVVLICDFGSDVNGISSGGKHNFHLQEHVFSQLVKVRPSKAEEVLTPRTRFITTPHILFPHDQEQGMERFGVELLGGNIIAVALYVVMCCWILRTLLKPFVFVFW